MKKISAILLYMFLINPLLADDVSLLQKGDPAPYTGYLFSKPKEAEVRQHLLDLDTYKQLDASNQKIIQYHVEEEAILKEQSDLWHTQADSLSKQLVAEEDSSFYKKALMFGLGCLVTTALVFGVRRASK